MAIDARIRELLRGGDRRSIGRVGEVVALIAAEPALFAGLIAGMSADDPLLRMRCADAAEKLTVAQPELLRSHKARLLRLLERSEQQEVRWHLAQMLPRLPLSPAQAERAMAALETYGNDRSSIVRTFTMQAMHDLAVQHPALRERALLHIRELAAIGTAAMRARGRRLIASLERAPSLPKQTSRRRAP